MRHDLRRGYTLVAITDNVQGDRISQTMGISTTNYTLDTSTWLSAGLEAGLTQVLGDGENTYLYGHARIAQETGTGMAYYLTDGLGSVRQLVDSVGDITLSKNHQPYGEVAFDAGSGTSSYGFTGEMTDLTGLIYLRARYYAPSQGRFLTRDVWRGDLTMPLSQNGWNYVEGNPVNLMDPSGLSPTLIQESSDHRDLTYWLYEEMSENANGYYVQRIRSLLNSSDLTKKARAIVGWIFLVKDEAKWDSKHRIKSVFRGGESIRLTSSEGSSWYDYSVPGNTHYGFVGRGAGFSSPMLHTGAGYAEVTDPAHKKRGEACCPQICRDIVDDPWITLNVCVPLGCYYINPAWITTLFDDPADYWNVEFGVRLFDTYHSQLTYQQFSRHLATYGYWLTPAATIPNSRFEHPNWPYWSGYFDGPDTRNYRPIVDLLLWRAPLGD